MLFSLFSIQVQTTGQFIFPLQTMTSCFSQLSRSNQSRSSDQKRPSDFGSCGYMEMFDEDPGADHCPVFKALIYGQIHCV